MSSDFEKKVMSYFTQKENIELTRPFPITIGFNSDKKSHKFDFGSENPKILIECKNHSWTKSGNAPSAKMSVWNEAMLYFSVAPMTYRKILFVNKSLKENCSLAQYYLRTYYHLIPPRTEIWEFDKNKLEGICVYPNVDKTQTNSYPK